MPTSRLALFAVLSATAASAADDAPKPSPFYERLAARFAGWDTNRDGVLSQAEIGAAVTDPNVKGEDAAVAAALKRATRSSKSKTPPVSQDNVKQWAEPAAKRPSEVPDFDGLYKNALGRIASAKRDLFPAGVPCLEAVHQGKSGDCFCLAPLGATVARDPKAAAQMFKALPDGSVEVALGGGRTPVVVAPLTDAEIALTASTENDGIWVNVYEKAVGQHLAAVRKLDALPVDVISRGGSAGSMVEVVTGNAIVRISCKPWKDAAAKPADLEKSFADLRGQLTKTFAANRLVCGGTAGGIKVPGITPNHAYAILAYDPKADAVTLWNPHGQTFAPKGKPGLEHGYPTADGKFTVPLAELVTFFGGFSFETDAPAAQ